MLSSIEYQSLQARGAAFLQHFRVLILILLDQELVAKLLREVLIVVIQLHWSGIPCSLIHLILPLLQKPVTLCGRVLIVVHLLQLGTEA